MTLYSPLFAKPGRLILDLNNIVDPSQGITGEYFGAPRTTPIRDASHLTVRAGGT